MDNAPTFDEPNSAATPARFDGETIGATGIEIIGQSAYAGKSRKTLRHRHNGAAPPQLTRASAPTPANAFGGFQPSNAHSLRNSKAVWCIEQPRGLYDDGWCDGALTCRFLALSDLRECQLDLWTPPHNGEFFELRVSVPSAKPLAVILRTGVVVVVQTGCDIAAGKTFTLVAKTDFRHLSPPDERQLSFVLRHITFN